MSENLMNIADLANLASMDTSEMEARTTRLQDEGVYILEVKEAGFAEQASSDPADPMNFILNIESDILAYESTAEGAEGKDKTGQRFIERYFLYGKAIMEAIPMLMGNYKKAGLDHKGPMGGVEGEQPGWVDGIVGKRIVVRVRHATRRGEDEPRAYIDWLSPKQLEKADIGITFEEATGRTHPDEEEAA